MTNKCECQKGVSSWQRSSDAEIIVNDDETVNGDIG